MALYFDAVSASRGFRPPKTEWLRLSLHRDRRHLLIVEEIFRQAVRSIADGDATNRRDALQPRSRVHDVASDHPLTELRARSEGDDNLARVDCSARAQAEVRVRFVQLFD